STGEDEPVEDGEPEAAAEPLVPPGEERGVVAIDEVVVGPHAAVVGEAEDADGGGDERGERLEQLEAGLDVLVERRPPAVALADEPAHVLLAADGLGGEEREVPHVVAAADAGGEGELGDEAGGDVEGEGGGEVAERLGRLVEAGVEGG